MRWTVIELTVGLISTVSFKYRCEAAYQAHLYNQRMPNYRWTVKAC